MKQLYICNIKSCIDHCKESCIHGKPHDKGTERKDVCTVLEYCDITNKKVKCRKLYKREEKLMNKGLA